jgi:pyruvate/2-oxoglutarate/acetoin dehydrogenase E1 component
MGQLTGREAINAALASELARDRRTVYLGETISYAGSSGASRGLFDRFGATQVIETPVSENGIFGAALGLAISGFRPIVEIYTADFLLAVANEVLNDMPKWRQQHATPGGLPITIRGWMGSTLGRGPEHSQCVEAFLHHAPGLTVICPGTPLALNGLLRAAIQSDEPTVLLEHRNLYEMTEDVPDDPDYVLPIGVGETVRHGSDATIVAWCWMRHEAVKAADQLAQEGIKVEIIDPRTIKPFDFDLVRRSVDKTGKLVVAEESFVTGSIGAEIITRVVETTTRPIQAARVAMPDVIHPYSGRMERELIPDAAGIAAAVRRLVTGGAPAKAA